MKKIITLAIIIFLSSGAKALTVQNYETTFKNISDKNTQMLFDTYIAGVLNTAYDMNDVSNLFYKKNYSAWIEKTSKKMNFF